MYFCLGLCYGISFVSPTTRVETISVEDSSWVLLSSERVINHSEQVEVDSLQLIAGKDYLFDSHLSRILILNRLYYNKPIQVQYSILPPTIRTSYYRFEEQFLSADKQLYKTKSPLYDLGTSSNLDISGSKTVSVSLASDDDLAINQALYIKLSGELSEGVFIDAQLNDSKSPLTTEGDTKELTSLDQVYLKIYTNQYELAFGDLDMSYADTQFFNYNPKFEGLRFTYHNNNSVQGAIAITKGKSYSYMFQGVEGKQGPYYLQVPDVGNVQVVSGSEQIYLNGTLLQRGDDYTIDYSEGSITFGNQKLIYSSSQIFTKFQYTDEFYRKNLYLDKTEIELLPNLYLKQYSIVSQDDKKEPLQYSLTDNDKRILGLSGDSEAWATGVVEVEEGQGQYIKVIEDTLEYYEYVGYNQNGTYNIYFSYVGEGLGNYEKTSSIKYEYVGANNGSWVPLKRLVRPEQKANYDFILDYSIKGYSFNSEFLLSDQDKNTFSRFDDGDNVTIGSYTKATYEWDSDRFSPVLLASYKHQSKNLFTFAPLTQVADLYNLSSVSIPDTMQQDEYTSTFSWGYFKLLQNMNRYRLIDADEYAKQSTYYTNWVLQQQKWVPYLNYSLNYSYTDLKNQYFSSNQVVLNQFQTIYTLGNNKLSYYLRNQKVKYKHLDSLQTGTKLLNSDIHYSLIDWNHTTSDVFYLQEQSDIAKYNIWQTDRKTKTWGSSVYYSNTNQSTQLSYSHMDSKYYISETPKEKHDMLEYRSVNQFMQSAVRVISNYLLKNIEFYPKVRDLQYVGSTNGDYDSTGVFQEHGGYDWVMIQVGKPQMSIDVNTELSVTVDYKQFYKTPIDNWISRMQTESSVILQENSNSTKKVPVYLLQSHYLMNEKTTLYGKQSIRQTVWYEWVRNKILSKVLYQKDKTLDNRYQTMMLNYLTNWESNLQYRNYYSSDLELSYNHTKEEDSQFRVDAITNEIAFNVRSRINVNLQTESEIGYTKESGSNNTGDTAYQLNTLSLKENVTWFFKRGMRIFLQSEIRKNARDHETVYTTAEKKEGTILKWSMSFDYSVTKNTHFYAEYNGNDYPSLDTYHQVKLEIKTEF